jgi:hypothetical protein
LLARTTGLAWQKHWKPEQQSAHPEQEQDPDSHPAEEAMAFRETALRQGASTVLWGLVGHDGRGVTPPPAAARSRSYADGMRKSVEEVLNELYMWEMSKLKRDDAPTQDHQEDVGIEINNEEDVEDDIWGDVQILQPSLLMIMMRKIGDEIGHRGSGDIFGEIMKLVLEAIEEPCGE